MKTKYMMYLDDDLLAALRAISQTTGAPVAELIRRAISEYLPARECQSNLTTGQKLAIEDHINRAARKGGK
jgi:predicted transcriptional regulator